MAPGRSLVAAVVAASMTLAGGLEARAQVPEEPTTTTEPPPPVTTTTPAPDDVAPSTTTTTTAPPPPTTTALSPTQPPATTTTTTAPAPAPPPAGAGAVPPPGGGDAAPPPPGALPVIPPELQARIDSVRRTGSNSTVRLLEKLEPLRAMGMTEQEAVQAGFGRFPVGGRATYTDDWWFPRFVPSVHLHEGTDIFAAYGTPVRAPANGVLRQTFGAVGGLSAYVHEKDDTYYYLAHLSRYEAGQVSGQEVKVGDVIGYVGDSGNARGSSPHVHFEIHPRGGGPVNPKPRLDAWLKEALAAVPKVVAQAAPRLGPRAAAAAVAAEEQDLTVVGHTDLGGVGGAGDVAVVGDTALVARGFVPPGTPAAAADEPPCEGAASLVDLSDPAKPAVAGAIELPGGQRVEDLDAVAVRSPAFTGDLAALVAAPCNGDGATELAYYDVTDAERPRLLARLPHPRELADTASARGACAQRLRGTCPRTGRTVSLQQDPSGRVVSLSTSAVGRGASEVYAVDASDPRSPLGLGWFPVPGGRRASSDPCAPVTLEPPPPPQQGLPGMGDGAGFRWATEARVPPGSGPDGLGAHAAVVEAGGRRLALAADDSWWSSTWAVRVDPPAPLAGDKLGCSGPLPGAYATASGEAAAGGASAGPTAGNLVYVGRGCPERRGAEGAVVPADPYLADPAGRVAVADAALAPVQPAVVGPGCTPADRLARARQAGALGLVVAGSFLAGDDAPATGAGPDEGPASGPGETRPPVPGVQLRKPDGDALRDALCPPAPPAAPCGAAAEVHASLVELPGQWGGLRVLDVTNPEAPREVHVYRPAGATTAAPGDAGSYAVHAAVGDGARVYAAWGAEGLRVIDLASGSPVEAASFVPPERTDAGGAPVPAHVTGVDHTVDHIVVSDLSSGLWVLDKRPPAGTRGYWLADAAGGVHAFGDAPFLGSASDAELPSPVVGLSPSPSGAGYRLVTAAGGVYAFGDASFEGSLSVGGKPPSIVAMAPTPSGRGYWLVGEDGGVFAFGDAPFAGSLAATPLPRPIVAVVAAPSGRGYWLVGEDGGVFAFGDAPFLGSTAGAPPSSPIVGAAASASGRGYWLVGEDGGIFAFGDAAFKGSVADTRLSAPVVGVSPMTGIKGYWLAGADGSVYALGAPFLGARPGGAKAAPMVAVAAVPWRASAPQAN